MQYIVVEADGYQKFTELMKERLNEGWKPQGGVFVMQSAKLTTWFYFQAMVKD